MSLRTFLKRAGVTTGPLLSDMGHTRLGWIKSSLLGNNPRVGKKDKKGFHMFGTYIHENFLLGKTKTKVKLTIIEKRNAAGMLKSLKDNVVVQRLMQKTVCEKTKLTTIAGVLIQYTPDAVANKVTGIDLKTTACSDEEEFIYKAFEYGYFRQGKLYSLADKLKEFYIIGIAKSAPHSVFIVCISDHKDYMSYVKQELDFLLYFYKNYGNFQRLEEQKGPKERRRHANQISAILNSGNSQASRKERTKRRRS